jgi:hypothetical protein
MYAVFLALLLTGFSLASLDGIPTSEMNCLGNSWCSPDGKVMEAFRGRAYDYLPFYGDLVWVDNGEFLPSSHGSCPSNL